MLQRERPSHRNQRALQRRVLLGTLAVLAFLWVIWDGWDLESSEFVRLLLGTLLLVLATGVLGLCMGWLISRIRRRSRSGGASSAQPTQDEGPDAGAL